MNRTAGADRTCARLDLPALLVQPDADNGVFPSQSAEIFEEIAAPDKTFVTMPGDHYFERSVSEREAVADLIADWLTERGATPA